MYSKSEENSRKNRKTIICPNCKRNISFSSSKKYTVFIKCKHCRDAETEDFIKIIRDIISSKKDRDQSIKEAMREYLKNPDSIHITAGIKKRYRSLKWKQQKLQEKKEMGISDDTCDLDDIKTISSIILKIYGIEGDDIKNLTRAWRKKIRILAKEIIARRAFVPLEKRRKNLKRPYIDALHKQTIYKEIVFMLCG